MSPATLLPPDETLSRDDAPPRTAGPAPVEARPGAKERLLSLDVFRGLTVAGMLLVNNPGSWDAIYSPLEHAPWNGWTPTDLIFPFFLFIVGITTHLSLGARRARGATDGDIVRQIVRRGLLILAAGLLLAAFPYYPLTRITAMRFPGVLQRIGVAYLGGALLTYRTTLKQQVVILAVILYGYWFAQTLIPVPGRGIGALLLNDPSASLSAWIDRAVFGAHLWINSKTWDPEGLLTTLPAVGTVILGVMCGRWLDTRRDLMDRLVGMYAVGAILMVVGLMWDWSLPISKNLWTPSYVLLTGGMAAVTLATCIWLVDVLGIRKWTTPVLVFGMNPLVAFLGSGAMARTIYSLIKVDAGGERVSLERFIFERFYASWLEPRNASLLFAVSFVLLWAFILWLLYRKRIFVKV